MRLQHHECASYRGWAAEAARHSLPKGMRALGAAAPGARRGTCGGARLAHSGGACCCWSALSLAWSELGDTRESAERGER